MTAAPRLGLIVNPIAGMGGRVGLKGTDGGETLRRAVEKGAVPLAESRAALALDALPRDCALFAGAGSMGERAARDAGFSPLVVGEDRNTPHTSAADTREIAAQMAEAGISLLLFAGGDGTARDVLSAVGERQTVLGIPAGVKIHSAAFARSPAQAGALAALFLAEKSSVRAKLAEVMDIDEDAYRKGELRAKLYGYLRIPYERNRVQGLKSGSAPSEGALASAIALCAADAIRREPETLWLICAGTTTRALKEELGAGGTLLGIDAYLGNSLLGADLSEQEILRLIKDTAPANVKIILTPIGGQGFLLGRGNQQLSPAVIGAAGRANLVILATPNKLHALEGEPFLTDTGDPALDRALEGYYRVVTGYERYAMYRLKAA